jgi:hypothetical protein
MPQNILVNISQYVCFICPQQYLDFWYQFKQNLTTLKQQGFAIEIDPSWTLDLI